MTIGRAIIGCKRCDDIPLLLNQFVDSDGRMTGTRNIFSCTLTLTHLDKFKAINRARLRIDPVILRNGLTKPPILCRRPLASIQGEPANVFGEDSDMLE